MQSGPAFWLVLLTLGVVVLAIAIGYGMMRNRGRTRLEKAHTEIETRREYQREDQDHS
jgi:UPF0716 family protein affecting phage T7 exclusion